MAASVSGAAKFLSSLARHNLSGRGYAAAAQGALLATSGKTVTEEIGRSAESAWVPDPVTGYYRPANRANEIDVAELREMLITQRIRSH